VDRRRPARRRTYLDVNAVPRVAWPGTETVTSYWASLRNCEPDPPWEPQGPSEAFSLWGSSLPCSARWARQASSSSTEQFQLVAVPSGCRVSPVVVRRGPWYRRGTERSFRCVHPVRRAGTTGTVGMRPDAPLVSGPGSNPGAPIASHPAVAAFARPRRARGTAAWSRARSHHGRLEVQEWARRRWPACLNGTLPPSVTRRQGTASVQPPLLDGGRALRVASSRRTRPSSVLRR
jgi:hypothetical protein